ncbi:MAG: cobalamin biosynthesis protein [Aquificaceae bacterium]|nr:MAG: cobalamin biosynthesis protein [Aquificaceae bacterium]
MSYLLLLPAVVLLDALLGEPRRYHPLIGFGYLANKIESQFNNKRIQSGVLAWFLLIIPLALATWFLSGLLGWWFDLLIGYLALGAKSLWQHAKQIQVALEANNIELARERVGWIVSRDTSELNEEEISKAAVESLLENGSDAIFATLFWFAIGGATGVLLYRLSNTLDAMWGYRNSRYLYFGRFSARIDDILNWIPARLAALSYCFFGDFKTAWHCWHTQGIKWYSPNAGPVMAAGAGALGLKLGGDAIYHGKLKPRLELGMGRSPKPKDISRAWNMIKSAMIFWCFIAVFVYLACK